MRPSSEADAAWQEGAGPAGGEPGGVRLHDPEPTGPRDCPSLLTAHGAPEQVGGEPPPSPEDLHLAEVVAAMAPGAFQRALWYAPLTDPDDVRHRQDVVSDLRQPGLRRAAWQFTVAVSETRDALTAADASPHPVSAELARLEALIGYTTAVTAFENRLAELAPASDGLRRVAAHLRRSVRDESFVAMVDACDRVRRGLRTPTVELGLRAGSAWLEPDSGRPPWADEIRQAFARFDAYSEAAPLTLPDRPHRRLNHVEARLVERAAALLPAEFDALHRLVGAHLRSLPPDLERLSEELLFFLGFLRVADSLVPQGVTWVVPRLVEAPAGEVDVRGMVDLALALRARPTDAPLVPNDLTVRGGERVVFVTGPNQGGKTAFARAVGLVVHLASLGLPVPATSASLPLLGPVLTHFPRPDAPGDDRGSLADELVRLRGVLETADVRSLVVVNELFSSTSVEDALDLSALVLRRLALSGCLVVWVTFLDDLVTSADAAVSLVGQVATDDPARPTFQFLRQPPTGRTHAAALAARHGLDAAGLARRLA